MLVSWIAVGFSCVALVLALWALVASRKSYRDSRFSKRVAALEMDNAALETSIAGLRDVLRRQSARLAAREKRAETESESSFDTDEFSQRPGETPEQWKARMRRGPLQKLRGVK